MQETVPKPQKFVTKFKSDVLETLVILMPDKRAASILGNPPVARIGMRQKGRVQKGLEEIVTDSNVYSARISRNKDARPKCASCMNHI